MQCRISVMFIPTYINIKIEHKFLDSYQLDGFDKAIQNSFLIAEVNKIAATFETPKRGRKRVMATAEEAFKTDFLTI